jgi:hypothetical protein
MPFVPGYEQDVFISYAHVNDLPPRTQPQFTTEPGSGWVAMLVLNLTDALAQKIGRREAFHIWFDQKDLRGNHHLTEEIATKLKRSATLLAVRSPGYLASVWCQDEARLFARHFKEQLKNRIFVVDKDPLDADAESLAELEGHPDRYRFWDRDHLERLQMLAFPMSPQEEVKYSKCVRNLADDLYAQLKAMGGKLPRAERDSSAPLTGAPAARRGLLTFSASLGAMLVRTFSGWFLRQDGSGDAATAGGVTRPLVFLNAEPRHRGVADQICSGIGDRATWVVPLFDGPPDEVREDLERKLINCDAMVIVCAENASWARAQLRLVHKLTPRRARPVPPIPVIDLSAAHGPTLGVHGLETAVIAAAAGIKPETLQYLSRCLRL